MTSSEQPPEWAIRAYPAVRQNSNKGGIITPGGVSISQTQIDQYVAWSENVTGKDELAAGGVSVAGSAVTGTVQTNSVGIAPATSVAVKDTNMLVSQNFTASTTVVATGNWSWWGDDGHLTVGCARVDCNGDQDDLVSNEILVVAGENVSVTVWVKWASLSYTGSDPIVLGVEKYRKGRDPDTGGTVYLDVGSADIATLSAPASSGDWTKLTGTYVVPAKVDQLRFRFRAAPAVTVGYVLWDEAEFKKTDLIPDAAVPGVGATVDNVVTNLTGQSGSGFTHDDESAALAGTAKALTDNSSTVSQLSAAQGTGAIAGDDFSYSGELIASTYWSGYTPQANNNPYYIADGDVAVWVTTSRSGSPINTNFKSRYDWQGTSPVSTTDYQKIQVVLSSGMSSYYPYDICGRIYLYGRISADWTSYVELELSGTGAYKLNCSVAGAVSTLTSGTWTNNVGAGSTITLYCGDKGTTTPRLFKAQVNGSNIFTYTDAGTSSYGASYRKWGWGGSGMYTNQAFVGYLWYRPPNVNQWIGTDQ